MFDQNEPLVWFDQNWRKEAFLNTENNLLISYKSLISDPVGTVNQVERFYGIKESAKFKLSKRRYTNHNQVIEKLLKTKKNLISLIKSNDKLSASLRKLRRTFFTGIDWSK